MNMLLQEVDNNQPWCGNSTSMGAKNLFFRYDVFADILVLAGPISIMRWLTSSTWGKATCKEDRNSTTLGGKGARNFE